MNKLFLTYREMATLFGVKTKTIREWAYRGEFKPSGWRRTGKWRKERVVWIDEVKRLAMKKYGVELS